MPPGQTILWMALVVLLCSTSALAADKKKNDNTDLVHDKQPENTTRIALLADKEVCPPACRCSDEPCAPDVTTTEAPFLPLMFRLNSGESDCCAILSDAFDKLNASQWNELNTTSILSVSEEKIANRCSYYDGVLKPCRGQCPLYAMMCHDTKQFVKELKCIKEKPQVKTAEGNKSTDFFVNAFTACGQESREFVLTEIKDGIISGVLCRMAHKYLECEAKFIKAECGPIAKALYMTQTHIWDDLRKVHGRLMEEIWNKDEWEKKRIFDFENLTNVAEECLAYTNFRINNTLLGSSSSHNTAYGTLIAAILVVCMLPVEVVTTLAQNRPKTSLWITAVLVLGLATGLVLSDDPQTPAPQTCKRCEKMKFHLGGIKELCCQPFLLSFDIDERFESTVIPTAVPEIYVDSDEPILLREETLQMRCGLYNESLKDCKKKCPLYGLICKDLPRFLEGLKCYKEKLEDLKFQVELEVQPKGIDEWEKQTPKNRSWIICERQYNSTQMTEPKNVSNIVKCANKLEYWLCVEKTFNETCPGIGAWLGMMDFFNIHQYSKDAKARGMYYEVPESIETECLAYATYIGKHIVPPGSSSPLNAAMSLGMVVAAIVSGVVGHHILMNFR